MLLSVFHGFGGRLAVMDVGPTTMNQIMHYCFKEIHLRRRDLNGKNQFGQLFIAIRLIDRRSRQGQRLSASMLSIYLLVCLSVCLSPKCKKTLFSQKQQFKAMVAIDDRTWYVRDRT